MTKTQQIEDLKRELAKARAERKHALWELDEVRKDVSARNLAAAEAKAKADAEAKRDAARAAEEETVDQIESGLIPVDALRDVVRSEYEVTQHPGVIITEAAIRLRSNDRVEAALHDAIFGYATGRREPRYVDGEYPTYVVELSPADRQLLRDIRDGGVTYSSAATAAKAALLAGVNSTTRERLKDLWAQDARDWGREA